MRAVIVEIDVPAKWKAHKALRLARQREKLFAERDWHNSIALTMQHQQRRCEPRNAFIGVKRVLDQPAHRREWIGGRSYIGKRSERRIKNNSADLAFCGDGNSNAGTKRFTPKHDVSRRKTRKDKIVGSDTVTDQTGLAWLAG